jgi:hypothetical protein
MIRALGAAAAVLLMLQGVAAQNSAAPALSAAEQREGFKTLFDGKTTDGWTLRAVPPGAARGDAPAPPAGPAVWVVTNGELMPVADGHRGHLVSGRAYGDFVLRLEFWVDDRANSGVFIRSPESGGINSNNAYEVNILDSHREFPTGSINGVQRTMATPNTVNKWNTMEITAQKDHLVVVVNGQRSVDAHNGDHAKGPFGLQALGQGTIKFRNIRIREL